MAIVFRDVTNPPLQAFEAAAPDGVLIGIVGEETSGASPLLRVAARLETPASGRVEAPASHRLLGPEDELNLAPVDLLLLDHALARRDWLVRGQVALRLRQLLRSGTTILLSSHEEELLRTLCDEIWWLEKGRLAGRGDPVEILAAYRKHIACRLHAWGETNAPQLSPGTRRGDKRAEILQVEILGESGRPTAVLHSGELAVAQVVVRFRATVPDPVIGILIRTRIGLNVYGTNTELERVRIGPCQIGDTKRLTFAFRCELCPQEYSLTVATHDPDGTAHDWLDDAIAFSVVDSRYTAGVANLRATVTAEQV